MAAYVQPATGLFAKSPDKPEIPAAPILGHGLADQNLEVRQTSLAVSLAGTHIASIDSDDNRAFGRRQLGMVPWRALDETELLLPQFSLHAVRNLVQVVAHGFGVERGADGKHVLEQANRGIKGDQEAHFVSRQSISGATCALNRSDSGLKVPVPAPPHLQRFRRGLATGTSPKGVRNRKEA